jgi:DNA-binding LacI/PurR family transcriptional regulator
MNNGNQPLYQRILRQLEDDIRQGRLRPGDRLPAEAELERQWGVSRITVGRAVRELQNLGLVHRVQGSGTFVNEAALPGAPTPPRSRLVAAIFPEIERNGVPEILAGIEEACGAAGLLATFHNSRNDLDAEARLIEGAAAGGCAGIILYPCFSPLGNAGLYSRLALARFPLALVDRSVEVLDLPLFACDNEGSMAGLARHVVGRGHRRIAFLCHSIENISSEQERFRGYARALLEAGIPLDPDLVCRTSPDPAVGQRRPGREERDHLAAAALDRLLALPEPPGCVMAVNDLLAISLMRAAQNRGLRIPADLAVTGFDNIDAGDLADTPLTTVAQPFRGIGRAAVAFLASAEAPAGLRLPGELVIRQSA